ncbi:MAG: hydrolase [Ruminiclostridium sp.]|nr:hydrolase [Ruminiclostridium sp.]
MKTILCYGDSNTWGYNPTTMGRYGINERWTGQLAVRLGNSYRIIEEGLNCRTTVWEDPVDGSYKSGKDYLAPCLDSHRPIDLVILWLGTNDLKRRFSLAPSDISTGVEVLIKIIENSASGIDGNAPEILLLSPTPVGKPVDFHEMFKDAEEKSIKLHALYSEIAKLHGCKYFNPSEIISVSGIDGVHFDLESHSKLAEKLASIIKNIFK